MPEARPNTRFMELVRRAPIVFVGTVRALGSSSLAAVPPQKSLAVVRVDHGLWIPTSLGDLKGKLVTVLLARAGLRRGEQAAFFTTSWMYGDGLAVIEVARLTGKSDPRALRDRVARARIDLLDAQTLSRLKQSVLVVSGEVIGVAPAGGDEETRGGEGATEWRVATVRARSVEKGALRDRPEVRVLFPWRSGIRWAEAPRFSEGQKGIWILHEPRRKSRRPKHKGPVLTALDPLDFHLLNQLERIRALLARR